ncbi:antibiotic biosynthesis monooxygenase [bacterium]|nr:MAG: antibiotic biosynthesis monooxygenase [bacterium]
MSKLFLHGKLTAKSGQGEELADILVEASKLVSGAKGCRLYLISRDSSSLDDVWVTEVWDSSEDHMNSLQIEAVRALIGRAIPILEGKPQSGQRLELLGGHGL